MYEELYRKNKLDEIISLRDEVCEIDRRLRKLIDDDEIDPPTKRDLNIALKKNDDLLLSLRFTIAGQPIGAMAYPYIGNNDKNEGDDHG